MPRGGKKKEDSERAATLSQSAAERADKAKSAQSKIANMVISNEFAEMAGKRKMYSDGMISAQAAKVTSKQLTRRARKPKAK